MGPAGTGCGRRPRTLRRTPGGGVSNHSTKEAARSLAPKPSTTCVWAIRSPSRYPDGSRIIVMVSRTTATTSTPGKRKATFRFTESPTEQGFPVSSRSTTSPAKNFPKLRPANASRSPVYTAPATTNQADPPYQAKYSVTATREPSNSAARSRRAGLALAYGESKRGDLSSTGK